MTDIPPVRLGNDFLLCTHECINGTHAVFLLCASFDACQWDHTVVDNDTNLRTIFRCARQYCGQQSYNERGMTAIVRCETYTETGHWIQTVIIQMI